MSTQNERNLALAIASCSDVCESFGDAGHPCHKVVTWQIDKFRSIVREVQGSIMHRPEPWTGELATAKIIFLASNPSFDPDENFPSWNENQWNEENIALFGAERFTSSTTRKYGATDSKEKSTRDRTIGINGQPSKKAVRHWSWVRQFAAYAMGKPVSQTSAISDYVMTELVHCKSRGEAGVPQALTYCSEKWFEKIMAISPAEVIFVAGAKAGEAFATLYRNQVPDDWGSWANSKIGKGKGVFPKEEGELPLLIKTGRWGLEDQKKNICSIEIGGKKRLVIYIARPGGGGLTAPWTHAELFHPEILKIWRSHF